MSELVEKLREYVEGRVKKILEDLRFVKQLKKDIKFLLNWIECEDPWGFSQSERIENIKERYSIQ